MSRQLDNSTYALKVQLRQRALAELDVPPVVMETHAGAGKIYARCYLGVSDGIAFEKDPRKAEQLARQRPGWAVYEADCVRALAAGAGGHLAVNVLDLDPYGSPWDVLDAFFGSERERAPRLVLAVNDGLRQKVRVNGGWTVKQLAGMVERFGNDLYGRYLEVAKLLLAGKAASAGYRITRWTGYYAGNKRDMTHYAAVLER